VIRRARESDSEAICHLAKSLSLGSPNDDTKGFLVYVLAESAYRARIRLSRHFYVSETDGRIDGYLMCYDDQTLTAMQRAGMLSHEDGIIAHVQQMPEPYIFGDQIGVSRAASEKKSPIGVQLMSQLFEDMKREHIGTMYVAILHAPMLNVKSRQFCTRLGFTQITEIANHDGTRWGLYCYGR
jgi:hypothetical protein